jgi:hypothetical protein
VKVVDEKAAYLRLKPEEDTPDAVYALLRGVLDPAALQPEGLGELSPGQRPG